MFFLYIYENALQLLENMFLKYVFITSSLSYLTFRGNIRSFKYCSAKTEA